LQQVLHQAVESVLTLLVMGLTGFFLARRGLAGKEVRDFLPTLVVRVALPLYLFSVSVRDLTKDELPRIVTDAVVAALSIVATFAVALLVYKVFRIARTRRGVFCVAFTFSNTMFLGMPINLSLFGDQALPHVISYFFFNSCCFWTFGNYLMSLDVPGREASILSRATVKRLLPPPLLGFFAGVFIVVMGVPVPRFVMDSSAAIGAMTTPLAIMYIGMGMSDLTLASLKFEKDLLLMLSGRLMVCPVLTFVSCGIFGLPTLTSQVFLIQSSLPVVAACSIMAGYYRSDTSFAIMVVSVSTIMSIVTVPVFRIITSFF
jgi:predicted permease